MVLVPSRSTLDKYVSELTDKIFRERPSNPIETAIREAIQYEREKCAKIAEGYYHEPGTELSSYQKAIAARIRAKE